MSGTSRGLRLPRLLAWPAAAALLGWLAGCAPHLVRPPEQRLEAWRERFERALELREDRGRAVEATLLVWAALSPRSRLPGVSATMWLGSPDSLRLVVNGLLGPAIDACALADSVTIWVPARNAAFRADAARDSIGVARPGAWLASTLAARWSPPDSAWRAGVWEDSLLVMEWREEDSLRRRLAIRSDGLPDRLELEIEPGRTMQVGYPQWREVQGVPWPMRFELRGDPGGLRVSARIEQVRLLPEAGCGCLAVPVPEDAEAWDWSRLRSALRGRALLGG
jgi:hypothetical protein